MGRLDLIFLLSALAVGLWHSSALAQDSETADAKRELAEWVIENGGTVGLRTDDGKEVAARKNSQLTEKPFAIARIDFGGQTGLSDADVMKLGRLPELVELNLSYTRITDRGLASLELPKLSRLYLAETRITDAALARISQYENLVSLDLSGTKITNKELPALGKLKKLSRLFLARTEITGEAVKSLTRLPELSVLHLAGITLAAEEVAILKSLSKLRELTLTTSDEALPKLAELPSLKILNVHGGQITDEGMPALAKCTQLEQLRLSQTGISQTGLVLLKASLKGSRIMAHPISRQSAFLMSAGLGKRPVMRWQPGDPKDAWIGLIPRPAKLPGIARWQLESVEPRSEIRSVDFSPNGEFAACGTAAGHVRIYDANNFVLKNWIPAHPKGVHDVAYSPDGTRLASAGSDGLVRIWNLEGKELHVLRGHRGTVLCLAWSPDGEWLASGSWDNSVRLWKADGSSSKEIKGHAKAVMSLAWSPDGQQFATGSHDATIRIWDRAGKELHVMKGHTDAVICLAWNTRGSRLASGSWDHTIRFWNPRTGRGGPVLEGHTYRVFDLEWHPEGTLLASAGDRTLRLWTLDGTPVRTVKTENDHILSLSWKHDGNEIATGTRQNSVLRVVNLSNNSDRAIGENTATGVMDLTWHPAGDLVAAGCWDRTVRLVTEDGRPGPVLSGQNYAARTVAWSPRGDRLASGGDAVLRLWNRQGIPLAAVKKHEKGILAVAWSPDGSAIATVSEDGTARIWNPEGGEQAVAKLKKRARQVAWSPDGQKFVTLSETEVRMWNRDGTPGPVLADPPTGLVTLDWNRAVDQIAVGGWSHVFQLWDGEGERGPSQTQSQSILDIAFDPKGERVAMGWFNNKLAIANADGTNSQFWEAHAGAVNAVAWHPEGRRIVSGAYDGTIRFWDANTREPLAGVLFFSDGGAVAFTPAGQLQHGDLPALEDDLIYLIETADGQRELLAPAEFEKRLNSTTE